MAGCRLVGGKLEIAGSLRSWSEIYNLLCEAYKSNLAANDLLVRQRKLVCHSLRISS